MNNPDPALLSGQTALARVIDGLTHVRARVGDSFSAAVEAIESAAGKVVVCGIGKSGLIGQKLAATFSSVGKPAFFLHAVEALHGDLGAVSAGDVALLISNSGSTEIVALIPFLKQRGVPTIAITGKADTPLGELSDICLEAGVPNECDDDGIVPSASTSAALALGDALAIAFKQSQAVSREDFAKNHPGGQLGRNLCLRVADVMQPTEKVAVVEAATGLRELVIQLTDHPQGAALVKHLDGTLAGIITDGDVRRALQSVDDVFALTAEQLMTGSPLSVAPKTLLVEAIRIMEHRPRQISVLPVVDEAQTILGLLRIHDVYPHR